MQLIIIDLPFRLHINLHAMHKCSLRKNGGVGLCVSSECKIQSTPSKKMEINTYGICTDNKKIIQIKSKLENIQKEKSFSQSIKIDIVGDLYFHCGLGVSTSLLLSCIESLFIANGELLCRKSLVHLSGRGGTSGIGIHSYFDGGLIVDGGVIPDSTKHLPSSFINVESEPLKILGCEFPEWEILYVIPKVHPLMYGEREKNFFLKHAPIHEFYAFEATYLTFMGIIPSILETNFDLFKSSLEQVQYSFWKSLEIKNCGELVSQLLDIGRYDGVACGVSSFGPGVYFISKNDFSSLENKIDKELFYILPLKKNNSGRKIKYG